MNTINTHDRMKNRTAFEMKRLFESTRATKDDRTWADDLDKYFELHYKFLNCPPEKESYHVGRIVFDIHDETFLVVVHQIRDKLHMVDLVYDVDGNLIQAGSRGNIPISDVTDSTKYEPIGMYSKFSDDAEFRKYIYLRQHICKLMRLLKDSSEELLATEEILQKNPYERKIHEMLHRD